MTDYDTKTVVELISLCKEKGLKGYAIIGMTKAKIIQLLKEFDLIETPIISEYDKLKYYELLDLCKERSIIGYRTRDSSGKNIFTKEKMIKVLKENNVRINLFNYLTDNNPLILCKFVGNQDILKINYFNTNKYYTWKCDNMECLNTFEAIARNVYKLDSPRKYCDTCTNKNRGDKSQIRSLKESGSIKEKIIDIETIWSKDNKKTPNQISPGSNEKVKLLCPNKSAKHPEYEISVYHIKESYCVRCPKCITKTSNAEIRIYSELKYIFKDVKWQQKIEGREADITVEDLKLVIEVDGFPWHKDKSEKDLAKNGIFEKNGYIILRIRDKRLEDISCNTIISNVSDLTIIDYNKIIEWINNTFKYNINIINEWKNIEYYKEIQAGLLSIDYDKSIEYLFPESKKTWDYEKNHPFIPSQFTQGSCMETWMKCSSGHSWKRKLSHLFRTIKNKKYIMKCPECYKPKSNKRIIQVNGKTYKSILEWCRQENIDRNILYKKLKQNNIDISSITNVQKFIEDHFEVFL